MYHAARKGKAELTEKPMKIYNFEILDYQFPLLTLKLSVGSGTYIRSIGYRLGQQLNLAGALIALERTSLGARTLDQIGTTQLAQGNIKGELRTVYFTQIQPV